MWFCYCTQMTSLSNTTPKIIYFPCAVLHLPGDFSISGIFCTLPHHLNHFKTFDSFKIFSCTHLRTVTSGIAVSQKLGQPIPLEIDTLNPLHWKIDFHFFCLMTRQTKKKDEKNHRLISQWIWFNRSLPEEFHIVLVLCLKLAQSPQQHCLSAYIFINFCFNNQ